MTTIQWTDRTWNVTRGCAVVSAGCAHCYAMRQAHRFSGPGKPYEGLTRQTPTGPKWTGDMRLVPERLDLPLRWRSPSRVFVDSMSDLFAEAVPDAFIGAAFGIMAIAHQHTFQILTKRPERMRDWCNDATARLPHRWWMEEAFKRYGLGAITHRLLPERAWPLENVWLGTSVEDQAAADLRIPPLLQTPAAVRFLSCEPLLGPIDLQVLPDDAGGSEWKLDALRCWRWHHDRPQEPRRADDARGIDWVIVGGESGPGARPMDVAWARSIVKECRRAKVPVFVKQLGADPGFTGACGPGTHSPIRLLLEDPKGGDPGEWPADLRVREWPNGNALHETAGKNGGHTHPRTADEHPPGRSPRRPLTTDGR